MDEIGGGWHFRQSSTEVTSDRVRPRSGTGEEIDHIKPSLIAFESFAVMFNF